LLVIAPVAARGTIIAASVIAAVIAATAIIAAAIIAAAIIAAAIIAAAFIAAAILAAVIIAASIITAPALIATSLALPVLRSLATIAALGVRFATLLFMSGLKLRCPASIGILVKVAFKVGDHLLLRDIIGVLVQCSKFFLMWFFHMAKKKVSFFILGVGISTLPLV
jgi:hypothetical protein